MHGGEYVADVIKRRAKGKDPHSYQIRKPITVIPVGERWADVVRGRVTLTGIIGWVLASRIMNHGGRPDASGWSALNKKKLAVSVNKPCTKTFEK